MFTFKLNEKKLKLEKSILLLESKKKSILKEFELEEGLTQAKKDLVELKIQHDEVLQTMKHERKIADEDIKHMIKMKEERLDLEHEKKVVELEREQAKTIAKVKNEYQDKMEERLQKEIIQTKEMYSEILARLPDINVKLKGSV